jgi:hypothetical protein
MPPCWGFAAYISSAGNWPISDLNFDPPAGAVEEERMQKINPFLWFDDQAEQAANFYVSIQAASGWLRVEG